MSTVLPDLSDALADAVASAADGLVRVEGRDRLPATGIIWDAEGLIVTSHHVLERDENIKVGFQDGESVAAELVGRDPSTDLALLRTSKQGLKAPEWADPENLRVGHFALSLGRPGANVRATMGIISALGKAWRTPAGGPVDRYLQTDTVMYPGFSGGPLVDAQAACTPRRWCAASRSPCLLRLSNGWCATCKNTAAFAGTTSASAPSRLGCRLRSSKSWIRRQGCCWSRLSRTARLRRVGCSWATR